jgi:pimeloyl-ACP methyl ester carboxylesterase
MFRCLPEFGLCFNYTYDQNSSEGIFIFHGFPSQKNRNKDLAYFLFESTKANVFVHHYEGIGESLGKFYFEKSLITALRYVEHIKKKFNLKRIHFLGHSWGGFVSLNLLSHFADDLGSVVLYSPFTQIPADKGINELAENLMREYPHMFFHRTLLDVCAEFKMIQERYNYQNSLAAIQWQRPGLILQAKNDLLTPEDRTRAVLPLLGSNTQYQELAVDHSFTEKRDHTFLLTKNFYKDIQLVK